MPRFARDSGYFIFRFGMTECGKSEQDLASCYFMLVVKRGGLLLRIELTGPNYIGASAY